VCYTQIKLENKTNILTNKNQNKNNKNKKEQIMAKQYGNFNDFIDVGFSAPPAKRISGETQKRIDRFMNKHLGAAALEGFNH